MNKIDQLIQDGIKEINNEVKQDDDIREQAEYIARTLAITPVIKVPVDGKIYVLTMRMVKDSQNRRIILLAAENEILKELYGNRYTPALFTAEVNDYFTLEENCQTLVSSFLGHVTGKIKIETLEEEGTYKVAREKDIIKE